MPLFILLLSLMLSAELPPWLPKAEAAAPTTDQLKNCPAQCGSVPLPYPFGFKPGCYLPGFQVECNGSPSAAMIRARVKEVAGETNGGTKELAADELVPVTTLSPDEVTVQLRVANYCGAGMQPTARSAGIAVTVNWEDARITTVDLEGSPYTLSNTRNKLTVIGCYSFGEVMVGNQPASVCVPTCTNESDIITGTCSVLSGCCQSVIPTSMKNFFYFVISMDASRMTQTYKKINPCSYAFLMDSQKYEFQSNDLSDFLGSRGISSVPVVLDWAIGNSTCSVAEKSSDYACGADARCVDSTNGPGYRCRCEDGYKGNPYVADGCQDINECEDANLNDCLKKCHNTIGNYTCLCPSGSDGDGRKSGKGCISNRLPLLQIILGCGIGILFSLICCYLLYWFIKKTKLIKM